MAPASSARAAAGTNKPLLLLYALARLKHDRQTEIRFNVTEADLQPLLRIYGLWGASARVSYPYSRLVTDRLWQLPDPADPFDAGGNIREGVARQRDTPAGFAPDALATFKREPELIDVAALHLLQRHFAPGLHEEILEAVGGCGAVARPGCPVESSPVHCASDAPRTASMDGTDGIIEEPPGRRRLHRRNSPGP